MTPPRTPTCCELACYEDPGCTCDGCHPDPAPHAPCHEGCDMCAVLDALAAPDPAPLDVERLARALPQVMTQEECDEVYAVGTNPLDVPYEWFTTPRELATDILSALEEQP